MRRFIAGVIMMAAVGMAAGCGEKKPAPTESGEVADTTDRQAVTPEDVQKETAEAVDASLALAEQTRDEYIKQVESDIKKAEKRLEAWREKSATLAGDARQTMNDQIDQLAKKRETLQSRLKEVGDASGEAWRELAQGMTQARKDLADALRAAEDAFAK